MKRVFICYLILLIFAIMISGCGSSTLFIQPSLSPTNSPSPTLTHTPTPTLTPTNTYTPTPTPTLFGGFSGKFITIEGYYAKGGQSNMEIFLWSADGRKIDSLWKAPTDITVGYIDVEWSPSGEALFAEYWQDGGQLLILDPTGEEIALINTDIHFYGGSVGQANWSSDGKWLVFSSYGEHSYVDIYRIDRDGKNLLQLTNTPKEDSSPIFTTDNNYIIYSDNKTGSLYIMDSDGENQDLLLSGPAPIYDISQDGKKALLYSASRNDMFTMDLESRELTQYTFDRSNTYEGNQSFSPDGNWILYTGYGYPSGKKFPSNAPYGENLFIVPIDKSQEPLFLATVILNNFRFTPDHKYSIVVF